MWWQFSDHVNLPAHWRVSSVTWQPSAKTSVFRAKHGPISPFTWITVMLWSRRVSLLSVISQQTKPLALSKNTCVWACPHLHVWDLCFRHNGSCFSKILSLSRTSCKYNLVYLGGCPTSRATQAISDHTEEWLTRQVCPPGKSGAVTSESWAGQS